MRRADRRIAGLLVVIFLVAGCASTPPERIAYNTLATIQTSVETAMTTAGDMYRAKQIDEATKMKIIAAYETYRKAFDVAVFALKAATPGAPPDAVTSDAVRAAMALLDLVNSLKR